MSVAKEGKVFEQKKLLQPLLDTYEGTKITWISLFLTSPTPTVYSNVHPFSHILSEKAVLMCNCAYNFFIALFRF